MPNTWLWDAPRSAKLTHQSHSQDSHTLVKRTWKQLPGVGPHVGPILCQIVGSQAPRKSAQATTAQTVGQPGERWQTYILNIVTRIGLTKKVTFEQKPKGSVRASKPCGCLREEMPERRSSQGNPPKAAVGRAGGWEGGKGVPGRAL